MDMTTKQLPRPSGVALPEPQVQVRRRWPAQVLGGLAEVLTHLAEVCLSPLIVLPLFFAVAGGESVTIGRAVAIVLAAGSLGAALAAPLAGERWPRVRLLVLVVAAAAQAILLFSLARANGWLAQREFLLDETPLTLLALAAACGGVARTLRLAVAGIVRPEGSWRTRWGRWVLLGALGTCLGGLAARGALERTADPFPAGFSRLFGLAAAALGVAILAPLLLLVLHRRRLTVPGPGRPDLSALPELLVNNLAYNRYVVFRIIYACGAVADPFYILYAVQELRADGRTAAAYLLTLATARAIATVGWRALSIGSGNSMVLQLASFVRLLAPITALTLPPILGSATLRDRLPGGEATNLIVFSLVFAAWGAASAGLDLAGPAIQAAITTPRERLAAGAVTNIVLALSALALPLGGLIADRLGYSLLFIVALVTGIVTLLAGGLIDEPGVIVLRAAPGDRAVLRRRGARREG